MKILGDRVYLDLPELPESKIELSPETRRELRDEMSAKFDRLKVFAIGQLNTSFVGSSHILETTPSINIGDEVFVDPQAIRRGTVLKIDDKEKICVNYRDIMHIW